MRTKPVPALSGSPAPKAVTLTLDMDAPPAPVKPVRRASAGKRPSVPVLSSAKVAPAPPERVVRVPVKPAPASKAPRAAAVISAEAPAAPAKPARRVSGTQKEAAAPAKAPAAPPKPPVSAPKAKAKVSAAKTEAVTLEREMALEGGGRVWRMSGRHAVAYVQNSALACALLAVETRHLKRHAMAVYYDKKGRAIAWQVRFDTQRWEDVLRQLG